MKTYCIKCNQPTEFISEKPKFCSNCGHNFTNLSIANSFHAEKPTMKRKILPKEVDADEADDTEDQESGINIDIDNVTPFKFEIQSNFRNTEKLGQVALDKNEGNINTKTTKKTSRAKKISPKEFQDDWKSQFQKNGSVDIAN